MKQSALFLWGLPGSGKSTVGRLLAKRLGRKFVDLDLRLRRVLGMSIPRAFEYLGESKFRGAESRALRSLDLSQAWVVAGGGGLPMKATNRAFMRRHGISIYFQVPLAQIGHRLGQKGMKARPLLAQTGLQALKELARKRKKIYDRADLCVKATGKPAQIAARIEKILKKRAY